MEEPDNIMCLMNARTQRKNTEVLLGSQLVLVITPERQGTAGRLPFPLTSLSKILYLKKFL